MSLVLHPVPQPTSARRRKLKVSVFQYLIPYTLSVKDVILRILKITLGPYDPYDPSLAFKNDTTLTQYLQMTQILLP